MSSTQYVNNVINTAELKLKNEGRQLRKVELTVKQPFLNVYCSELEQSNEQSPDLASRYPQFIGILRWALDLGIIDIFVGVFEMPHYSVSP